MDGESFYLWFLPFSVGSQVIAAIVNFATDDPLHAMTQLSLAAMFLLYAARIRQDRKLGR